MIKRYTISVGDIEDADLGMYSISLVRSPAMRKNFLRFSEQMKFSQIFDEEKRIVTGVAIIPGFPIYRYDPETNTEFEVVFDQAAIDAIVLKYSSMGLNNNVDTEHNDVLEKDVIMTEMYQINHERGIVPVEFADCPTGTLIVSYKVLNDDIWERVKSGELQGFSVSIIAELINERLVPSINDWEELNFEDMSKHNKSLLFRAAKFLLSFSEVKTKDGLVFNLEGDVPTEGMAILDAEGKPLEGTFELEDGCTIECAAGMITKVVPAAAPEEPVEEAPSASPEEGEKPAEEATEMPLEEEEKPTEEQAPAEEQPAEEAPVETPEEQAPAEGTEQPTEVPLEEQPAEEQPAEQQPAEEQPVEEDPLKQANAQIAELKARNAELIAENEDLRKQIAEKDVQNIENGSLQFTSHRKPGDTPAKDVFSSMLDYMASK